MLIIGCLREVYQLKNMSYRVIKCLFISIYILISFFILIKIKLLANGNLLIFILLCLIWSSDIGGYIIGSFGKNYFSKISPKKTYEGLAGSVIFCIITSIALKGLMSGLININFVEISLYVCASSILGDLIVSKVKRINNKKISGYFLPGHGGFLDRLDSLFLATPIYYFNICM